jgi:flagellar biosynthesis protein FliP
MIRRFAPILLACLALGAAGLMLPSGAVAAQTLALDLGDESGIATGRIVQIIALITVLSLAPSILVMVTSFTRIVIVLSFVRTALGAQQTPPNQVLVSLALFLTLFVMMPTLEQAYDNGIQPLIEGEIDEAEAFKRTVEPLHTFMMGHVREQDLTLFLDMANRPSDALRPGDTLQLAPASRPDPETVAKPMLAADHEVASAVPLRVLIPAFMVSELRRAFEIGFLIFVPFLIIDMVVASVLMSMGMMMLPPVIIALPFKIIFFVLVDGWYLVVGSLVRSFGG